MSSNDPSIRVRGQRLIPSTFIHRTSTDDDQSIDRRKKVEDGKASKKRPKISLSDFLNRKLQKTSDPSKFIQGKEKPFVSPVTSVLANQSIHNNANADQKTEGPELNGILQLFKHSKDNKNTISFNPEESQTQNSIITQETQESPVQDSRASRKSFGGLHIKPPAPKGLVVLGGDPIPRPKQRKHHKPFIRDKKPPPLYNHYAGGSGWWDSDMEGIDNEAVGFNEVWEGVGSTTLGGLDWH